MIQEIEIPGEIPVMTLGNVVLFPQAMMPLYIFEKRYRIMLETVLHSHRIFAVAGLNEAAAADENSEIPHSIASVGIIRACQQNADGTSNLILQGISRIQVESIITEDPYPIARVTPLQSINDTDATKMLSIKPEILSLLQTQKRLGAPIPKEVIHYLSQMSEPEGMLDLAIYSLCPSSELKQQLLETRKVMDRHHMFLGFLHNEIARLKLENHLKGDLDDHDISNN